MDTGLIGLITYLVGLYIWLLQEVGLIRLPWQTAVVKQAPQVIEHRKFEAMMCKHGKSNYGDNWKCHKLPAKTVKVFGHTMNLAEGCNICRANLLKQVVKAQKPNKTFTSHRVSQFPWRQQWGFVPDNGTIEIKIDDKIFTANGDFKAGDIKKFMAGYVGRSGKIRYSLPARI